MKRKNKCFRFVLIALIIMIMSASLIFSDFSSDVSNSLDLLKKQMQNMEIDGFNTVRISDYVYEAEQKIVFSDLVGANISISEANNVIVIAYQSKEEIDEIRSKIAIAENKSIDTLKAQGMFLEAKKEFLIENYEGVIEFCNKARRELSKKIGVKYAYLMQDFSKLKSDAWIIGVNRNIIILFEDEYLSYIDEADIDNIELLAAKVNKLKSIFDSLFEIKDTVADFEERGLSSQRFKDILSVAAKSIDNNDFDAAKEQIDEYQGLLVAYNKTQKLISDVEKKVIGLQSEGVVEETDVNSITQSIDNAKKEYNLQNYEKAYNIAQKAFSDVEALEYELILSGVLVKQSNFKKYSGIAVIVFLILLLLSLPFYKVFLFNIHKTRQELLYKKIAALQELLEEAQDKYFKKKSISRAQYNELTDKYQESIINSKEKLYVIEKRLKIKKE